MTHITTHLASRLFALFSSSQYERRGRGGGHPPLRERLPDYARPLFIRIVTAIELTGTFKLRKQQFALEGFDPARIRDTLYIDDAASNAYVPFDVALHTRLQAGKLRL